MRASSKVAAIGSIEGERYYWMIAGDNDVAMIPAVTVEQAPTLANFAHKLTTSQQDLPPEMAEALDKRFMELYEPL